MPVSAALSTTVGYSGAGGGSPPIARALSFGSPLPLLLSVGSMFPARHFKWMTAGRPWWAFSVAGIC